MYERFPRMFLIKGLFILYDLMMWIKKEQLYGGYNIENILRRLIFWVCIIMQQKKYKILKRDAKSPNVSSSIGEKISLIGHNKSQDTRSKLHSSKDSQLRDFNKKNRIKLNTLSSIGSLGIEQLIKKEIALSNELLRNCEKNSKERILGKSQKAELIDLQDIIKEKDEMIRSLAAEIENIKKSDKHLPEDDSHVSNNKFSAENNDKQKIYRLTEQMRIEREDLSKCLSDHAEKYNNYFKVKKLIQQIQQKYTRLIDNDGKNAKHENYSGPLLMTFEDFKDLNLKKKLEAAHHNHKTKKAQIYHHLSPEKQLNASKNMKDLISRKTITLAALKNSRKKHAVQMNDLFAKIEFLKDQDIILTQKITEKQHELITMEKKFSEKKGEIKRGPILNFH